MRAGRGGSAGIAPMRDPTAKGERDVRIGTPTRMPGCRRPGPPRTTARRSSPRASSAARDSVRAEPQPGASGREPRVSVKTLRQMTYGQTDLPLPAVRVCGLTRSALPLSAVRAWGATAAGARGPRRGPGARRPASPGTPLDRRDAPRRASRSRGK